MSPETTAGSRLNKAAKIAAAAIAACILVVAFVAGPRSCEGGLEFYFWFGVAALVVLLAIPIVARGELSNPARTGWAFGFLAAGVLVWIAGFAAADFRIMCRLF